MSKRTRAARLRRTWPQRLLITFNSICIVAALVGAGTLAYAKKQVGDIDRYVLGKADGFEDAETLASTDPRNFLIVGADSDDGLDLNDPVRAGRDDGSVGGIRSDTIMVVRLDPETKRAKVLSFPRDLYVDIPGYGSNRINASLQFGGPELLIETIKSNFDIDINHYVQVDFAGFKDLVELIDGVPVYFGAPVRDQGGLNIQTAGCTTLDENGALQYVRARHLEYMTEDGTWDSDPTSDLGRISRQQDFIKRVMRRAVNQGARDPRKLAGFIDVATQNITLDESTTTGQLVALGRVFRSFDPNTLETFSLPVLGVYRGGAAVLDLQTGGAEPILAQFRGTGDTSVNGTVSPAAVGVQVLNGSGKRNQAAEASAGLEQAGFQMVSPSSAPGVARTEIRYAPGQEEEAVLVARYLFADPLLVVDPDVAQVTVVTGPDFGSVVQDPRPATDFTVPTTTTTTTSPGSSEPDGSSTSEASGSVTTTTVDPNIYLPGANPPGVSCG